MKETFCDKSRTNACLGFSFEKKVCSSKFQVSIFWYETNINFKLTISYKHNSPSSEMTHWRAEIFAEFIYENKFYKNYCNWLHRENMFREIHFSQFFLCAVDTVIQLRNLFMKINSTKIIEISFIARICSAKFIFSQFFFLVCSWYSHIAAK